MNGQHKCGVDDLDYGNATEGFILCEQCGRLYRRTSRGHWTSTPKPTDFTGTGERRRSLFQRRGQATGGKRKVARPRGGHTTSAAD